MYIRFGFDLAYEVPSPVPMLLMLYTHPSRAGDLLESESIYCDPSQLITTFNDSFGNRCGRVVVPAGRTRFSNRGICIDSGLVDESNFGAEQWEVEDVPVEALQFLMPSRYCESDRLSQIAWNLFGNTPRGWTRVQTVCDWVHQHIRFGYQFARSDKTAWDGYNERQGVCRDFTHLLLAMLRALNIPARYATGYLGDIGVPRDPAPMDFSAWTEVFLGGRWYTFDARHNRRRIGRIVMARGRDAADVALTTSFGPSRLTQFHVVCEEVASPGTAGYPSIT